MRGIGILARRAAPIQATYLGFPGTSGADFIDYVIADKIVLPVDQQPFFSEKIVHLPDSYQVNDSKRPDRVHPFQAATSWDCLKMASCSAASTTPGSSRTACSISGCGC